MLFRSEFRQVAGKEVDVGVGGRSAGGVPGRRGAQGGRLRFRRRGGDPARFGSSGQRVRSPLRTGDPRPRRPRGPRPPRVQVDVANATEVSGTVKWFSAEKGYCFVATSDGAKDVFVHVSVLEKAGISQVNEQQRVSMRVVETPKGREAVSISLAE